MRNGRGISVGRGTVPVFSWIGVVKLQNYLQAAHKKKQ